MWASTMMNIPRWAENTWKNHSGLGRLGQLDDKHRPSMCLGVDEPCALSKGRVGSP